MPRVLTLEKSISVLETVFYSPNGMGTRALAQQLGLNVATVHNIAWTFCERGYLRQDAHSKRFFPGVRLMLLGRHPSYLHSLTASAKAIVEDVAKTLNESILLSFIDHGRIVNLMYIPSRQALRVHEPEDVSDHAYCTAFGKVLLSSLSEQDLERYLQEYKLERLTPSTLDTPERLREELQKVREVGYASTQDEYCEGISAVAIPIKDPWGGIFASIGASAPTVRLKQAKQFENTMQVLRKAATAIESAWGEDMRASAPK